MQASTSRNLTFFRSHGGRAGLHPDFAADFGFRDATSRLSVLVDESGPVGPDAAFSHVRTDARQVFAKLLGLEVNLPQDTAEATKGIEPKALYPYRSSLHERWRIVDYGHWTAAQHRLGAPVEASCEMAFAERDVLMLRFRLRNRSAAEVPAEVAFVSRPSAPEAGEAETPGDGGFTWAVTQDAGGSYRFRTRLEAAPKLIFHWDGAAFRSAPERLTIGAEATREWVVRVRVAVDGESLDADAPAADEAALALEAAQARAEVDFGAVPDLPEADRRFETVAARAVGILRSNRAMDQLPDGSPVRTIHAGKCGVASTWWWDGSIHLLGLGLFQDRETIRGTVRLLLSGLDEGGFPPGHCLNGAYADTVQMPILAWGLSHAVDLTGDVELLSESYPGLSRYANWWLARRGPRGLVALPNQGTAQDDSPRWTGNLPAVWAGDAPWDRDRLARSRPGEFESPDVNTHLYLELRALAGMAAALERPEEAARWAADADALAAAINEWLFDASSGTFQDLHIESGGFTGYLTTGCFIPFYAGLASRDCAQAACRWYLLDADRFYTALPFAGVDQAHPAFLPGGELYEVPRFPGSLVQSAYWLGRVWPHYSYWLTGALWQSGLKAEADAAADRILTMWGTQPSLYECYDPLTGAGNGHPEFSWGAAAALGLAFRHYRRGALPTIKF